MSTPASPSPSKATAAAGSPTDSGPGKAAVPTPPAAPTAAVPTAAALTSPVRVSGTVPPADRGRGPGAGGDDGNEAADFATTLRRLIRARFPLLSIRTAEESRVLAEIAGVLGDRAQVDSAATGLRLVDVERVRRRSGQRRE